MRGLELLLACLGLRRTKVRASVDDRPIAAETVDIVSAPAPLSLSAPDPRVSFVTATSTTTTAASATIDMTLRILVGSYSRAISTLSFDPVTRTLRLVASTEVGHHPSWLARHPSDAALVYTSLEQADGRVLALRVDGEGHVRVVAEAGAGGRHPASFEALEDELVVGNVRRLCYPPYVVSHSS
jgi:hypothetical protein